MTPKSHHYNPQVYLRQFVNPQSKKELWEYNLETGEAKLSSSKLSGCEEFYHSMELEDGTRDDSTIEQSFQSLENALPALFEAIRNRKPCTERMWANLFLFAALQRARCPKALHSFRKGMSEVYKKCYEIWKHSPDFEAAMIRQGLDPDEVRKEDFEITANRSPTLALLLQSWGGGNLAKLFARMKWAFLVAPPSKFFLTSDDPVCCWVDKSKRGPFGAVGPADADVEVTFPLSRRVCAFAHWSSVPPTLYYSVPADVVDNINYRTIGNGWRFVYGPVYDPGIADLIKPR